MKRIIKNNLLAFILGAIIFGSIGVIATTVITADQVDYDSNHTVKEKIDDLYDDVNRDLTFSNKVGERNVGGVLATGERAASITLNKGKYIVTVVWTVTRTSTSNTETRTAVSTPDLSDISCTNNCNIVPLIKHASAGTSDTTDTNSKYKVNVLVSTNYYIDVVSDNTIVTGNMNTWTHSAASADVENILINAFKVTK